MKKLLPLVFILLLMGCASVYRDYDPYSGAKPGVMYHYSGTIKYKCIICGKETNLYRLDTKDRVVCKKCFQESKRKYLYH